MAETKYGKYIITELKTHIAQTPWGVNPPLEPAREGKGGRILWLDNEVVPGAFYVDSEWFLPWPDEAAGRIAIKPHKHDFDEVIAFLGTNLDDPHDLGAEVELWLGDEKHIITKSCFVYVPKGLQHCPLRFIRVDRPVFHFTTGRGSMYF